MSVYKPKGKPSYLYDFQLAGHRYHGTTGCSNKKDAEKFEERQKALARQVAQIKERVTLQFAIAHYMANRGMHAKRPDAMENQFARTASEIGPDRFLDTISTEDVMNVIARRRAEVTDSTVNRSVTQPLRRVWRFAEKTWKGSTGDGIDWSALLLREPQERVREISADEETAIISALRSDILPLFKWSMITGMRKGECIRLRWADIDFGAGIVNIHGKGDRKRKMPLTHEMLAILTQCRHHAEFIFTYEKQRARDGRKGERRHITESVLREVWDAMLGDSGIGDLRWHDIRHTAATRLLRKTNNLSLVQKLLGHERITTTTKYAHSSVDDLRRAMESRQESRPVLVSGGEK